MDCLSEHKVSDLLKQKDICLNVKCEWLLFVLNLKVLCSCVLMSSVVRVKEQLNIHISKVVLREPLCQSLF